MEMVILLILIFTVAGWGFSYAPAPYRWGVNSLLIVVLLCVLALLHVIPR